MILLRFPNSFFVFGKKEKYRYILYLLILYYSVKEVKTQWQIKLI
ncbi:predicted protein [Listeria monocytogenes J2818]|nr:predicted protein [Listeria monocytogenes J2818]